MRSNHTYIAEGTHTATVCLSDDDDAFQVCSTRVITVQNVAPTVTASGQTIDENGQATISGTISDPGPGDTFDLTIDWADGVIENFGPFTGPQFFSKTHVYLDDAQVGTPSDNYVVLLTSDDGFAVGSTSATVTVAMPKSSPTNA